MPQLQLHNAFAVRATVMNVVAMLVEGRGLWRFLKANLPHTVKPASVFRRSHLIDVVQAAPVAKATVILAATTSQRELPCDRSIAVAKFVCRIFI